MVLLAELSMHTSAACSQTPQPRPAQSLAESSSAAKQRHGEDTSANCTWPCRLYVRRNVQRSSYGEAVNQLMNWGAGWGAHTGSERR